MTASTGAYAADAVVFAEPEPVEYVRVCDVYGAGFFYIPGTETCLKIGGYFRQQINFASGFTGYDMLSRFAPTFDVRSETEWGTLRGFAEVEFNYQWGIRAGNTGTTAAPVLGLNTGYATDLNLNHAYIEVIGASGTFRIGKGDSPYTRFLGYGASGFNSAGSYGFQTNGQGNTNEVSYTFNGGNGFSAIIALVDNVSTNNWQTNIEGGINFRQGWGSIGAIVGYDPVAASWGAKAVARVASGAFSGSLHVFYASGPGSYNVSSATAAMTNWSVLAHARVRANPTVDFGVWAQWFDSGNWNFAANVGWTPVQNLLIRPEITYATSTRAWAGSIRFERSF